MNKVAVVSLNKKLSSGTGRKAEKKIRLTAARILRKLRKNGVFLEIFLADNGKMRFLNRKFRGKNKAANVLSFKEPKGFIYPGSKYKRIGEIYLKLPITPPTPRLRRAGNYPITQLLAHGILHLFGYSHSKKIDRIKMEKREKEICSSPL